MVLKARSAIDYLFAFGISFFITILFFEAATGNRMDASLGAYYIALALLSYTAEFFAVLWLLNYASRLERKNPKKRKR